MNTVQIKEMRLKEINLNKNRTTYIYEKNIHDFLSKETADYKYKNILDFGAGNSPYKKIFSFKKYTSVDVEQNITNSIDLIINPGCKTLPFESNSIDLVLCLDVLEHVPNPK